MDMIRPTNEKKKKKITKKRAQEIKRRRASIFHAGSQLEHLEEGDKGLLKVIFLVNFKSFHSMQISLFIK